MVNKDEFTNPARLRPLACCARRQPPRLPPGAPSYATGPIVASSGDDQPLVSVSRSTAPGSSTSRSLLGDRQQINVSATVQSVVRSVFVYASGGGGRQRANTQKNARAKSGGGGGGGLWFGLYRACGSIMPYDRGTQRPARPGAACSGLTDRPPTALSAADVFCRRAAARLRRTRNSLWPCSCQAVRTFAPTRICPHGYG